MAVDFIVNGEYLVGPAVPLLLTKDESADDHLKLHLDVEKRLGYGVSFSPRQPARREYKQVDIRFRMIAAGRLPAEKEHPRDRETAPQQLSRGDDRIAVCSLVKDPLAPWA